MLNGDFYPHPVKDTYWQFLNELTYFRFVASFILILQLINQFAINSVSEC